MRVKATKGGVPSTRKLTEAQEQEVTRLYAKTTTPVAQIARSFKIGESSVYRVAQRHGASLRGKTTTPKRGSSMPKASTGTRRRSVKTTRARSNGTIAAASARTASRTTRGATKHRAAASSKRSTTTSAVARVQPMNGQQRFRIRFLAERVIGATSLADALRKAKTLGATDVTSVTRA
jgi:hypothetical protein